MKNRILAALASLAMIFGLGVMAAPASQADGWGFYCRHDAQVTVGYPVTASANIGCYGAPNVPATTVRSTLYRDGVQVATTLVNRRGIVHGSWVSNYVAPAKWYNTAGRHKYQARTEIKVNGTYVYGVAWSEPKWYG